MKGDDITRRRTGGGGAQREGVRERERVTSPGLRIKRKMEGMWYVNGWGRKHRDGGPETCVSLLMSSGARLFKRDFKEPRGQHELNGRTLPGNAQREAGPRAAESTKQTWGVLCHSWLETHWAATRSRNDDSKMRPYAFSQCAGVSVLQMCCWLDCRHLLLY